MVTSIRSDGLAVSCSAAGPDMPAWLFEFAAMGSPCRLRLAGVDSHTARAAADRAIAEVRRIEQAWSRYRDDSIVSRINAAAGGTRAVDVDTETAAMLDFGATLWRQSGGLFDLSSGVLRRAWDYRAGRLPAAPVLQEALALVGWERVEWDGQRIRLPQAGMQLDFGGVGKEYAVDRAATLLIEAGLRHGVVNLGGDLRAIGPRPDGSPWPLAVAHPRQPGAIAFEWPLASGAIATSGDYERFLMHDGRRYGHILDPRTGWPVSAWSSITVAAPSCLAAGALSTVAMLAGAEAPAMLRAQGVPFVAIDLHGLCHECDGALSDDGALPAITTRRIDFEKDPSC